MVADSLGFAPDGAVMPSSGRKPRETDAGKQTVAPDGAVVRVGGVPRSRFLKLRFCIRFCWPKAFIIVAWGIAPGIENKGK